METSSLRLDDEALNALMTDSWNNEDGHSSPLPIRDFDGIHDDVRQTETETMRPPTKQPKKWQRRKDRSRPYHEIPRLKEQILELQRQLQLLQTQAGGRAHEALDSHIANATLKTTLRKSLKRAQTFRRVLDQQWEEITRVLSSDRIVTARTLPYDAAQDETIFKSLATKVDELHQDMSRVLHLSGLHGVASYLRDAQLCRSGNASSGELRSRSCVLSPFSINTLNSVVWNALLDEEAALFGPGKTMDNLALPLGSASRVAIQKQQVKIGDVTCTKRLTIKQFTTSGRSVFVWHALAEWPLVGTTLNLKSWESGWGVHLDAKGGDARVCQSFVQMVPNTEAVPPDERWKTIELLSQLYQDLIVSRLQGLENRSIDGAMLDQKQKATC